VAGWALVHHLRGADVDLLRGAGEHGGVDETRVRVDDEVGAAWHNVQDRLGKERRTGEGALGSTGEVTLGSTREGALGSTGEGALGSTGEVALGSTREGALGSTGEVTLHSTGEGTLGRNRKGPMPLVQRGRRWRAGQALVGVGVCVVRGAVVGL
jgi:hypothetical protein